MSTKKFRCGISKIVEQNTDWLTNHDIALVCNSASVNEKGQHSSLLLSKIKNCRLHCIFSPEHGFNLNLKAGEFVPHSVHAKTNIPIYSLYGKTRKPTARILKNIDTIIFDIQGLATRTYTYLSTLQLVMSSAAQYNKKIIVADRPVPLPAVSDGPILIRSHKSFVGMAKVPMAYGMTYGETALWFKKNIPIKIDLKIGKMTGYHRENKPRVGWPEWIPPSPQIRNWESACCYPATVFCEAMPSLDNGRNTARAFQVVGAPWIKASAFARKMRNMRLPGINFKPIKYKSMFGPYNGQTLNGLLLSVTDPASFRPILTAVSIISVLQELHGYKRVWQSYKTRTDFFDKLFGTDKIRKSLMLGEPPRTIAIRWRKDLSDFRLTRKSCMIYHSRKRGS